MKVDTYLVFMPKSCGLEFPNKKNLVRCSGRDPPSPERDEAGYGRMEHIKKSRSVLRKASDWNTPLSMTTPVSGLFACSVGWWIYIRVGLTPGSGTALTTVSYWSEAVGLDQAVLAGAGLHLCLSQAPFRSAGYRTTVWGKRSLAVDETYRN